MSAELSLDPDSPGDWPAELQQVVRSLDEITPPATHVVDLEVSDAADVRVREAMSHYRIKAFHATRLLPHEVEAIKAEGLRAFGAVLFDDRIEGAFRHGHLTEAERAVLLGAHMHAVGEENDRGNRTGVWLTLRRVSLDHHGNRNLLGLWGGEGISFSSGAAELGPLLARLGRPVVVVAAPPILTDSRAQLVFPDLSKTLLGAWRGLEEGADLRHPTAIEGDGILDLSWWEGSVIERTR